MASRRRNFCRAAAVLAGLPQFAFGHGMMPVNLPPGPPPATLEVRIGEWSQYVVQGVPRRILYLSDDAVADFFRVRREDAAYARLLQQGAPEADVRARVHALPFDAARLALSASAEVGGMPLPYLEFDVSRVLYRHRHVQAWPGEPGRIYLALGPGLVRNEAYRQAWERQLGQEVILLTEGPARATSSGYLPTPYPVHLLVIGNHMLDQLPLPLEATARVREIAQRAGMIPVDKP